MKDDLISRSVLKKAFDKWWGCDDIPATVVEDTIDNAPTVKSFTLEDIEGVRAETIKMMENRYARPQGEWIKVYSDLDYEEYQCSICGRVVIIYKNVEKKELLERYPFCNCGAKMKGGAE